MIKTTVGKGEREIAVLQIELLSSFIFWTFNKIFRHPDVSNLYTPSLTVM